MAEVQSGISCFLSTEKHKPQQIHLSVLIKTPCIIKISSTQSVYNVPLMNQSVRTLKTLLADQHRVLPGKPSLAVMLNLWYLYCSAAFWGDKRW